MFAHHELLGPRSGQTFLLPVQVFQQVLPAALQVRAVLGERLCQQLGVRGQIVGRRSGIAHQPQTEVHQRAVFGVEAGQVARGFVGVSREVLVRTRQQVERVLRPRRVGVALVCHCRAFMGRQRRYGRRRVGTLYGLCGLCGLRCRALREGQRVVGQGHHLLRQGFLA